MFCRCAQTSPRRPLSSSSFSSSLRQDHFLLPFVVMFRVSNKPFLDRFVLFNKLSGSNEEFSIIFSSYATVLVFSLISLFFIVFCFCGYLFLNKNIFDLDLHMYLGQNYLFCNALFWSIFDNSIVLIEKIPLTHNFYLSILNIVCENHLSNLQQFL